MVGSLAATPQRNREQPIHGGFGNNQSVAGLPAANPLGSPAANPLGGEVASRRSVVGSLATNFWRSCADWLAVGDPATDWLLATPPPTGCQGLRDRAVAKETAMGLVVSGPSAEW